MIFWPKNPEEHAVLRGLLKSRGAAALTNEAHLLAWTRNGEVSWVVGFDQWCGQTCQMHWCSLKPGYLPKEFRIFCFTYAFRSLALKRVFGQTNSLNSVAIKIQKWLGFREVYRAEGCHKDGGDIIFLEMRADGCKWIRKENG